MSALIPTTWVAPLLNKLPAPLLKLLNDWAHRTAVRRQVRRQEAWIRRRSAGQV